jgi:hypothetical protein
MDKEEIIRRSKEIFNQFTDICLEIPDEKFFFEPKEKWSIAENADHLIRAIKTTQLAYSLPKPIVRLVGGKPNRASRSYDELVKKYKLKLEQGGKATGRYIPKISAATKFSLMQHWQKRNEKYLECLELKWKDLQLDKYLAPHPLLGKITLRELCYFTIYHTEHHLNAIKARLSEQLV